MPILLVVAALLAPIEFSYGQALTAPGSATVSVRTVEWLRDHGAGRVVDLVEYWYYSHNQPSGAAPDPKSLPASTPDAGAALPGAQPPRLPVGAGPRLPAEGAWTPTAQRVAGVPPLYTAYFRPDPSTPSVVAGVAWLNQALVRTRLVAGTMDPVPAGSGAPADTAGGEVPARMRGALLATFNSGFKLKDARGGYYTGGREVQALVPGAASLVIDRAGRVDVGQWGRDLTMTPTTMSVRQNLALIVEAGAPVPGLDANPTGAWGTSRNQLQFTWRSGLGVDAGGNLVYVAADQLSLDGLAHALAAAGAVRGMQLDIHPQTVGFLTYAPGEAISRGVGTALLPSMHAGRGRYLQPSQRDFLAVAVAPAATP